MQPILDIFETLLNPGINSTVYVFVVIIFLLLTALLFSLLIWVELNIHILMLLLLVIGLGFSFVWFINTCEVLRPADRRPVLEIIKSRIGESDKQN